MSASMVKKGTSFTKIAGWRLQLLKPFLILNDRQHGQTVWPFRAALSVLFKSEYLVEDRKQVPDLAKITETSKSSNLRSFPPDLAVRRSPDEFQLAQQ